MKKLLGIVVLGLLLSTNAYADDIKDFQIEGISIGDSLLDYFSEKEIKEGFPDWSYKKKTYKTTDLRKNFKIFSNVQFSYKTKDANYTIEAIDGMYDVDIKDCLKEKDEQVLAMQELLSEAKIIYDGTFKHNYDKTGKSKITEVRYKLKSGGWIKIACYDWSDKLTSTKGWNDQIRMQIQTKKFDRFLKNAY